MINALIGSLSMHNYDLRNMKKELELSFADMLTGILKRFEDINDQYGHNTGNLALKEFQEQCVRSSMPGSMCLPESTEMNFSSIMLDVPFHMGYTVDPMGGDYGR